jgi:hypothetical protein
MIPEEGTFLAERIAAQDLSGLVVESQAPKVVE